MRRLRSSSLLLFGAVISGCASFSRIPVGRIDDTAVTRMKPLVISAHPEISLYPQTKALLTYLASADLSQLVRTPPHNVVKWKIRRIIIASPASDVSIVCDEGHWDEVIHFTFRGHDDTWVIVGRRGSDRKAKGRPVLKWDSRIAE